MMRRTLTAPSRARLSALCSAADRSGGAVVIRRHVTTIDSRASIRNGRTKPFASRAGARDDGTHVASVSPPAPARAPA